MSPAYSHERSEERQVGAQKDGELWNDDDFTLWRINHYCTESIINLVGKTTNKNGRR